MTVLGLLLQTGESPWAAIGAGGGGTGLAGVMFYFYRQRENSIAAQAVEREKAAEIARKAEADRYAALALDFREIVQNNTAVLTKLMESDPKPRKGGHGD